ncbi:MAG TPA: CHAT domain-containing protein, partial [Thermoanaerobaculia bacterium]|nr:CHAT domain-containing protein [Thermoanaerobaculia bacterium]
DPARVVAVKAALADTRARWEQLETTLQARYGALAARPSVDPLRSPRLLLPNGDDVLLDFVVSPERTIVFVFSRRGEELSIARHIIAAGEDALARDVDRFLNRLGSGSFDYDDDARRLHRLLLAPAAAQLRGAKRIGIVADGPLWRLPFQVLQGSDGEPLAASHTIFYAPSLESLLRPPAETVERPAVLAIGNPRFGGEAAALMRARTRETLGDLPDAGVEARTIARMYDDAQLLTGAEATESALKEHAGEFDVLHIAAHAVTDDAQPLYSAIMLAPDPSREGEDGILEAREITRLPLRARLAVISACSTAQGKVRPGEGIIGLSWAFLVAGCPTIVASQWRVPSASTARLMIEFHRELSRGVAPPEALQRAQMTMMSDRRYRHPFHWAAFVVVGAGR